MTAETHPTLADIRAAHERIRPHVHRTPVLTCAAIDERAGMRLHFKCENLQKVGAFKARGAMNAVLSLSDDEAARGVVTHSSGNHAAALARAAAVRGVPAYIVMPDTAPQVKVAAVEHYGGRITFCHPTLAARESTCRRIQAETGATLIHPYDDARVIAGQGTAALELLEDVPTLDAVMTPVGGGGLLAGTAIVVKSLRTEQVAVSLRETKPQSSRLAPRDEASSRAEYNASQEPPLAEREGYYDEGYDKPALKVFAGEPRLVDDAYRSLQTGSRQPATGRQSVADGLLTSLGELTFPVIRDLVDGIFLADEDAIRAAQRLIMERMKIVVEPSAAVPLAALLVDPAAAVLKGRRVGVILSGGNVDLSALFPGGTDQP